MSERPPHHTWVDDMYRRHGDVVLRRACQLLGREDEAREVVQDLFTSLISRPQQFEGKSSVTTWLYSATTHLCLNRLRNQRNRARLLEANGADADAAAGSAGEAMAELRRLFARLPQDLAQLVVHFCVDGMTYDEIATVMGCSRRHVANLMKRLEAWRVSELEDDASSSRTPESEEQGDHVSLAIKTVR